MISETRRQGQRRRIRALILEAAREAFIRDGYENFSMRKLAGKIDYSPGTLYLYFKDKEDLVNCLADEGFARLLEALEEIPDSPDPVVSLRRKLRAYIDFGLSYPNHYHFAFLMRPSGDVPSTPPRPRPAYDILRTAVRRCVERKRFRSGDVEITSQVLWTTIHGVTSLLIVRPNFPWVDRETLIDRVLDTILEGLGRGSGTAGEKGVDNGKPPTS